MSDEFDDFARNLQEQIFEETKDTYGIAAFERWRDPLYIGAIDNHGIRLRSIALILGPTADGCVKCRLCIRVCMEIVGRGA